jgi:predicted HAD superfamily phosphohydrolase YqeG
MEVRKEKNYTYKPFSEFKQMPKVIKDNFSIFDIQADLNKDKDVKEDLENQNPIIAITKQKHCGTIDKFDSYLKTYERTKSNFTVVSYGSTKKIIYGKNKFVFSGLKKTKKPLGIHLVAYVKKDIDKLVEPVFNEETQQYEESKYKIPKIPTKRPHLTFIHHKNLDWYGAGQQALAIDINHCYWRTAYLLGFITEFTYNKGIEKKEYKDGRLIAIGTLGKILTVTKYVNGVKSEEYQDDRDYIKYGGFFWAVITKVHALLLELWTTLKEDFLMFLTDCVVIDPCKREISIAIIEKHGYSCKEFGLVFTDIDENRVAWVTDDGKKKQIIHNKMLGKM